MSVENKHIIYTAEDIKRYLSGSMAPAEMHAIEMAALDDPLLAEAMQGYEGMEEKDWSKELAALKQKLNTIENSPVVPISQAPAYKWWRAAAAVLLLGTSVVTAYIFTSKKQPEPTPVATVVTGSDSLAVAYADSVSVITNNPTITPGNSIVTTEQAGTAVTLNSDAGNHPALLATTEIKEKADSSFIYRPETSVASYDIKLKDNAISTGDDMESRRSIPEVSTTAPTAANSQYANEATFNNADLQKQNIDKFRNQNNMNVNPGLNYYSGVVLTPDNKAVGYANINTVQNNKPVYTDANGRFKLPSTDSTLKVTVTSAGYNTQHFTLQNSNTLNKIVLQPQEVVTEKIGQSGKKKAFLKKDRNTF
ncbi:MAG: carboxypeptidase-like regulatory domain-containing protein [Chitinophagaceae bacterium]|nr:carboxypeptidase-like regulatory domain-containing protein [Chitinophagaceae bacterium]